MPAETPPRLNRYPYEELRFDASARLLDGSDERGVRALLGSGVTDLVVLAHGWNNDMDDARALYRRLAASLDRLHGGPDSTLVAGRQLALVGVLWPSKKFAADDAAPGGAASYAADPGTELAQRIEEVQDAFDADDSVERFDEAKALIPDLEDSAAARARFVELVRGALPPDAGDEDDATAEFLEVAPDDLFRALDDPTLGDPTLWGGQEAPGQGGGAAVVGEMGSGAGAGGADGTAVGWGLSGGVLRSARNLLNFATYYQMKARAGKVGAEGLAPVLRSVVPPDLRVHLVGHSFGGRLVTAAAASPAGVGGRLGTVALLQAAFSHYGFAKDWKPGSDGAFRGLLTGGRLQGPLVITHTRNDTAVGVAYALASRVANQVGAEIGGPDSRYGGIGANGAQDTPGARQLELLGVGEPYAFTAGTAHNLVADRYIADHGAVSGAEVAHAVLSAIGST